LKILITGSNGLVGSSLTRILTTSNPSFNILPTTRKDANLFSFEETKNLILSKKPDVIVNAAAKVGGILANNTNRTDFILENLKININLLESLVNLPEIKLINLGSSCIYPLDATNPISEDSLMTGKLEPTNSPYAMAKLTAIEIGDALKKEHGHKIINVMPTNLYGPNDHFSEKNSHVIPGLIFRMHNAKLNNDKEFKVWGTGKPLREFLYVDDLSKAINHLIENNLNPELINIGSGDEIAIKDLVNKISKIINYDGEIIFDDTKPDGNPRKLLDSSKVNSYGWDSEISLDQGLKLTYKWFNQNF
tara:strand:+ start:708 stop:1625 length:918 start_codon:yes stop_codon:yes gene_type:complete